VRRGAPAEWAARAAERPVYPPVLAASAILAAYAATYIPLEELWRPLIVGVALAVLLTVLLGVITREWHASAFIAALVVLAVVGLWQVVVAAAAAWLLVAWLRARRDRGRAVSPAMTPPLNVLALAWLAIAVWSAVAASIPPTVPVTQPVALRPAPDAPNIYVLLLDGYPRADTLMSYFGFDNEPFLTELERLGFDVNRRSESDYVLTLQALPTILHMRSGESLGVAPWLGTVEVIRQIRELIHAAPAVEWLEGAGYTTFSLMPPTATLGLRAADHAWQSPWLTTFEARLIQEGALNLFVTDLLYAQHRATILDTFAELERIAGESVEPRFTFAHVMSPHAPFAFAPDGSAAAPPACEPGCGMGATILSTELRTTLEQLAPTYLGQVEFVNGEVLDAVETISATDPNAVIVVMSDHGTRLDLEDPVEWRRNLFASRTPGRREVFAEGDTPTALFPRLFNAYFDADLPIPRPAQAP
jgi:hypothetical protein